jgi:indolepyruvate ferredoxin oxidoreductase
VESVSFNLHPPLLRRFGVKKKMKLGSWFRGPLKMLAAMKGLRGTALDVFSWSAHRRMERELIGWYRGLIEQVLERVTERIFQGTRNRGAPDQIRGYEHIKEENIARAKKCAEEKLAELQRVTALV